MCFCAREKIKMKNKFSLMAILLFFCTSVWSQEYKNYEVEKLLNANEAPSGVVFEIITWEKNAWDWATPMLKQFRTQLLTKFPELDIALVSHGGEQFELVKSKEAENKQSFKVLKSLTNEGVDVHVCGTHSSWRDVPEAAYADFIDVSPSGPAQINDYIKLGFTHILLKSPL